MLLPTSSNASSVPTPPRACTRPTTFARQRTRRSAPVPMGCFGGEAEVSGIRIFVLMKDGSRLGHAHLGHRLMELSAFPPKIFSPQPRSVPIGCGLVHRLLTGA